MEEMCAGVGTTTIDRKQSAAIVCGCARLNFSTPSGW